MMNHRDFAGVQPWDEDDLSCRLIELVRRLPRGPISEAALPDAPGAYLLFLAGPVSAHGALRSGSAAVYAGKARSLAERQRFHVQSLSEADGIRPGMVSILAVPTTHAAACYVEALLLEECRPAWNRLGGFGCRVPGSTRREGRTSKWDACFPGRYWARVPTSSERRAALAELAGILAEHGGIRELWPPLWAPTPRRKAMATARRLEKRRQVAA